MHYMNGVEAKEGDQVIYRESDTSPTYSGTLYALSAQSNTCNGRLANLKPFQTEHMYVTISKCLLAEDAMNMSIRCLQSATLQPEQPL